VAGSPPLDDGIVIVGGGQAGGRAAGALRKAGYAAPIVLVGAEPEHPYERPPLSKAVLRGEKAPGTAALVPAGFYEENRIELVKGLRVDGIDAAAHRAVLSDGRSLAYAKLLLATGGRVRTLPFAPLGRPGVHYLRTVADALALGAALRGVRRLVVIGGGFLGLEVAASARLLGLEVALVEIKPHLLDRAMAPEIARHVEALHRTRGVTFHLGATVADILGGDRMEAVELGDGTRLAADLVVVAVGIVPNIELAAAAGAALGDGILVDHQGRTSLPDIFAAGDVANHPNPILGRRLRLESWQNAQNQGIAAARAMAGEDIAYAEVPWFWSDQYDANIQMVGAPEATDQVVLRGEPAGGRFLCFNLTQGAVTGATAFNMGGEIRFARKLVERRARLDPALLADPARKLKDIAAELG
jgi:3-phenylpropionate/trans-cinnamate dioxygenase ferredoxin reductase component